MTKDQFVKALCDTIAETIKEQKVTHPEDIMVSALTTVEAIYKFAAHLPAGTVER